MLRTIGIREWRGIAVAEEADVSWNVRGVGGALLGAYIHALERRGELPTATSELEHG